MYLEISSVSASNSPMTGAMIHIDGEFRKSNKLETLVREAIQNSLGAVDKNVEGTPLVKVLFSEHILFSQDAERFINLLTDSGFKAKSEGNSTDAEQRLREEALNRLRIRSKQILKKRKTSPKVVQIRDTGTVGLNGDWQSLESNYFRLVSAYAVHTKESGRGGSEGVGRSIYFMLGSPFVVFYTRVKTPEGKYEERLSLTLAEDAGKTVENWVANFESGRGSSTDSVEFNNWGLLKWRSEYRGTPFTDTGSDADWMRQLLSALQIERFAGNETGTVIAIPFAEPTLFEDDEARFAGIVRKFYAPRLGEGNADLCGLEVSYKNGTSEISVLAEEGSPADLLQLLYLSARDNLSNLQWQDLPILTEPVVLDNDKGVVGRLSWIDTTDRYVGEWASSVAVSENAFKKLFGGANPSALYSRRFGQILSWEKRTRDTWKWKNYFCEDGQYRVSFFVPTNNPIADWSNSKEAGLANNADDVLRRAETGIHDDWVFDKRKTKSAQDCRVTAISDAFDKVVQKYANSDIVRTKSGRLSDDASTFSFLLGGGKRKPKKPQPPDEPGGGTGGGAGGGEGGGEGGGGTGGAGRRVGRGFEITSEQYISAFEREVQFVITRGQRSDKSRFMIRIITPSGDYKAYSKVGLAECFPLKIAGEMKLSNGSVLHEEDESEKWGNTVAFGAFSQDDTDEISGVMRIRTTSTAQPYSLKFEWRK